MKLVTALFALWMICLPVSGNDSLDFAMEAFDARDFDTAIKSLETSAEASDDRDILFHLARIQYRVEEFDDALDTLEKLHNRYPDDVDAQYLLGLVYLSLVGEVNIFRKISTAKRVLHAWERAVEIDPGHLNARYAIFAYYANAPGIAGGDLETAKTMQMQLSQMDPGFGAMARGLLLSKNDDVEAAEAAFLEAISLIDRAGPHFTLAQFYMQTEQFQKAIAEVENFVRKDRQWWDPDITVAHLMTARANAGLGNIEIARSEASLALSLRPNKKIKGLLEETLKSL
jgi:tetratricopeptide (TPR) repeat protein